MPVATVLRLLNRAHVELGEAADALPASAAADTEAALAKLAELVDEVAALTDAPAPADYENP